MTCKALYHVGRFPGNTGRRFFVAPQKGQANMVYWKAVLSVLRYPLGTWGLIAAIETGKPLLALGALFAFMALVLSREVEQWLQ